MKPIAYSGACWLPEEPETKLHGAVEGDGVSRVELALKGAPPGSDDLGGFRSDVILGYLEDGKALTLCNCLRTGNSLRFGAGLPGKPPTACLTAWFATCLSQALSTRPPSCS